MHEDASNQRRAPRLGPLELPAEVVLASGDRRQVSLANLGPDGAFVSCGSAASPGDRVELRFELQSHPIAFQLEGDVRWRNGHRGFGVQFRGTSPYDRAALDDYCQCCLERSRQAMRGGQS